MTTVKYTACVDCGQQVPVIATGRGDVDLPRCPAKSERHRRTGQDFHRVPRDEYDAAVRAEQEGDR